MTRKFLRNQTETVAGAYLNRAGRYRAAAHAGTMTTQTNRMHALCTISVDNIVRNTPSIKILGLPRDLTIRLNIF